MKKVLGCVVAVIVLMLLWVQYDTWRDERLISNVKECIIAEDVTLSEGLQAFLGTEGIWWRGENNIVYLDGSTDKHTLKATFEWVGDDANILQFYYDYYELSVSERNEVLWKMVQAAQRKR